MSQVVRIPSPLFQRLQQHATPLIDSTADVISRLLDFYESSDASEVSHLQGSTRAQEPSPNPDPLPWSEQRSARGALTERYLRNVLLVTLLKLGGQARTREVIAAMRKDLHARGLLASADLEFIKSNPWERWETFTRFARKHLVDEGLMLRGSPTGVWELSDAGRKSASLLSNSRGGGSAG